MAVGELAAVVRAVEVTVVYSGLWEFRYAADMADFASAAGEAPLDKVRGVHVVAVVKVIHIREFFKVFRAAAAEFLRVNSMKQFIIFPHFLFPYQLFIRLKRAVFIILVLKLMENSNEFQPRLVFDFLDNFMIQLQLVCN
jgi:hypothetical protein